VARQRYGEFFYTVIHSLQLSLTIIVYQLFEKRKKDDTASIYSLVRSLPTEHEELALRITSDVKKSWPLVLKVFALRNEVYGHRSATFQPEDVFNRVGITPGQFKSLVELAQRCIASLAEVLEGRSESEFFDELRSRSSWATEDLGNIMLAIGEEDL